MSEILSRLVTARKAARLNQQRAAEAIGLTRASSLSDLETGRAEMKVSQLLALCELYGVSSAWIIEGNCAEREPRYGVQMLWTVHGELREMDWRDEVAAQMQGQERVLVVLAVATGDKHLAWQHVTSKMLRCTSLDDLSAAADQEREIAAESGTIIYGAVAHVITPEDLAWVRRK